MKRKTKEQREEIARAALRQRIEDIALGAEGDEGVLDKNGWFAGAHCLSRLIPALRARFGLDDEGNERTDIKYLWYPSNLDSFDNVDTITDFLYEHGVRAR
jgi:hypothetical protein